MKIKKTDILAILLLIAAIWLLVMAFRYDALVGEYNELANDYNELKTPQQIGGPFGYLRDLPTREEETWQTENLTK